MISEAEAKQNIRELLEFIGDDPDRVGLKDTPERMLRMFAEMFRGYDPAQKPQITTFPNGLDGIIYDNMVVDSGTFYSVCEHHLLPFYGKAHVAYIPNGKVAGLSKLARTVEVFARRPQIQENMTAQIADALEKYLKPKGVMVMIEAEHMCMTMRGVQKPGSKTVTTMVRGVFAEDYSLQQTFLQMVNR